MSCDIKPNKRNFYISESTDFNEFSVDQTVLIKAEYLSKISLVRSAQGQDEPCDELYTYVNSYYSHTEDSDALNKVNSLLAQPDLFEASKEREALSNLYENDHFSEKEAQIAYLESKPVSFIILGKPDIGQQEMGRDLARYWNCVYVEPQQLIEEEIECGSRAGQCIEFNLRCGRAVGIDIILNLVAQKVKSEIAKHRGFVLCGLPVIPNDLYEEDPVSSQSAVFTAKDIFEEVFTLTTNVCIAPSNPQVTVSSNYQSDVGIETPTETYNFESAENMFLREAPPDHDINIGKNYEKQLEFLFNLLEMPYFILYVQCGSVDVLSKRDSYRFDVDSNQMVDLQRRSYNHIFQDLLVVQPDVDLADDLFDSNLLKSEDFRLKNLVKLPGNFKANISAQLDHYHYVALNFIQNRVIAHNPEYFIKVDGRCSVCKMLNLVKARLEVMNVQKVLVPRKLASSDLDTLFKTTDTLPAEDTDPIKEENLTPIDCFKLFKKLNVSSKWFLWTLSEWETKCPVSMKMGVVKEGRPKYAVQFMNKIFFLASENAFFRFIDNPRPFLLPPFPRSTCRIFIFGPKRSGRSALAQCLAYYLGGSVLSSDELMNEYLQQRQDEYLEKVRQQAIAEAVTLLNETRFLEAEELEKSRIEQIKEWVKEVVSLLEQMIQLLDEIEKEENVEKLEISSFPMAMKKIHTSEILEDSEYAVALLQMRNQLQDLNIPIYKLETNVWKSFVTERKKLLQFLPAHLSQKQQPKPATVFDDFVKDYVDTALANAGLTDFQLSGGGIFDMFMKHIKMAEAKYQKQGFESGGWIIDGMMCNLPIVQSFFPDYTGDDIIILKDNTKFLIENYKQRQSTFFEDFRNFFINIGAQDAAWRCPAVSDLNIKGMVKSILQDILDQDCFYDVPFQDDANAIKVDFRVEEYKKEMVSFEKEWLKVKKFYQENNVFPIEIDVSNKSLPELFQSTIKSLDAKYTYKASKLTEEDRGEEREEERVVETFTEDVSTTVPTHSESFSSQLIRKYGDTFHFCPVSFTENFVLWMGKEAYACKYNDKTYLLATEEDMKKFVDDPCNYLLAGYNVGLPPPRICVIGVSGCGKTFLSKSLSENYGLIYLSYDDILKKLFKVASNANLIELAHPELHSYLNSQSSLPPEVMSHLTTYWLEDPYRSTGFVFDDFPKNRFDVDFMVKNKLIPDVIIYPQASEDYIKSQFLQRHLKMLRDLMEKQRMDSESKYNKTLDRWREERSVRFNALIEERREKRYVKKLGTKDGASEGEEAGASSLVSFDSVADQFDVDEVNKLLDIEMPPLVYEAPVDNSQALASQNETKILSKIQTDVAVATEIKDICLKEQIHFMEVSLNLADMDKTRISCFLTVEPLKFRTRSFLEITYDVSVEVAESLLTSGYVFLSKFGKTCPVQYYDNEVFVQLYRVAMERNDVFPIVHRSYVYYIVGLGQRNRFKSDPLKYTSQRFRFPLLRHKVAVTGPPKCGKTTLSRRVEKEFGFKLITRGQAVRYVLQYLFLSDLAKNIESILRKGWEVTDDMVIKCVEAATFHQSAVTQGIVFDGFPNSLAETRHLAYLDLIPSLVIDLQANRQEVLHCLSKAIIKSPLPKYGVTFTNHLYEEWLKEAKYFRSWFDKEYQAMTKIPITFSTWSVWHQSKSYFLSTFAEINHYYVHIVDDWPLRLANMLVTPLEYLQRQSDYKTYCPVCLHYENSLVHGGEPPDRTGVVQYRSHFYWICDNHIELFLKTPDLYLPPYNNHRMPPSLPKKVSLSSMPDNVYENGACAVCYKTKRIITKGSFLLAAAFNDKVYLFDTVECLFFFLKSPNSFMFGIEFHTPVYPELKYKELPILGMLEQFLAKYIVSGISFIAKRRPVIPGLSIKASALVGLGLYVKVKNERPNSLKSYYEEGFRLFNERRDKLLKYLDFMKNYRNPYLHYEEPLPQFQLPPASVKSQSLTTMMSRIVDQCVDNIDMYLQEDHETTSSDN